MAEVEIPEFEVSAEKLASKKSPSSSSSSDEESEFSAFRAFSCCFSDSFREA